MVQEAMDLQRCFGRNLEEVLLRVFGIQSLRPLQVEAIKALESKYDSLIILATGAGKSLIYQLPAVLNCGVTVVLSPILALIQDQVAILEDQEVAAEVNFRVTMISHNQTFRASKRSEAYSNLLAQSMFPRKPEDRGALAHALGLLKPIVIEGSPDRKEISYQVRHKELIGDGGEDDVMQDMLAFIRQQGGSGILYAHTRESCEQLARSLREAGLLASAYHAGLEAVVRNKRQQDWLEADDEIMVATVAFGMGVNKCNVRWVIHWNLPKSVSHFYQ
eukprot:gene11075-13092_t